MVAGPNSFSELESMGGSNRNFSTMRHPAAPMVASQPFLQGRGLQSLPPRPWGNFKQVPKVMLVFLSIHGVRYWEFPYDGTSSGASGRQSAVLAGPVASKRAPVLGVNSSRSRNLFVHFFNMAFGNRSFTTIRHQAAPVVASAFFSRARGSKARPPPSGPI